MRAVIQALDFGPADFFLAEDAAVRNAVVVQVGTGGEALGYQKNEESEHSEEDDPYGSVVGFLGCEPQRCAEDERKGGGERRHAGIPFVGVEYGTEHGNGWSLQDDGALRRAGMKGVRRFLRR